MGRGRWTWLTRPRLQVASIPLAKEGAMRSTAESASSRHCRILAALHVCLLSSIPAKLDR